MEKLTLDIISKDQITAYRDEKHLCHYEPSILDEILDAAEKQDETALSWFSSFGDSVRSIIMNVHAYHKGLEFGFTNIGFDQYGWFAQPAFLQVEELLFGNETKYGEYSTLKVGKGINNVWTNALSYSYGTAGGGCALSVYGKQFSSRDTAVNAGILELKALMNAKVGDSDRSNFNPQIIRGTLNAIARYEIESVQLALF